MSAAPLKGLRRLLGVMARLRDPENGCPWDRKQTPASIAPWTIEEACELAQAIETGDTAHWQEELGDLLFHVVFHARLGEEAGLFDFNTVAGDVAEKLEQRHPHVFGDEPVPEEAGFNRHWEQRKSSGREHIDDHLPVQLPALMQAYKLQKRAAAVGFDWSDADGPKDKIREELDELDEARGIGDSSARDRVGEELGDLLFAVVNYGRHLGVEPEQALRAANRKFIRRFRFVESRLSREGLRAHDVELDYLDALWDEAKRDERK